MKNVVLCGCGGMAHAWVGNCVKRNNVRFVGLVDLFIENAEKMKDTYNLDCNVYTSLDEALAENDVDLVLDVTIPDSHFGIASTAMRAGCDVFSEKPMASDLAKARELVEISKETGKMYAIMQNRRYLKDIRAFKEVTDKNVLGEMGILQADFYLGAHFGGFRDVMDNVLILDMAVHTFDMARFIYGCNPVSVYCQEHNPKWSWYKGASSAVCIFEMENGGIFVYNGSWSAEGCQTSWEADWRASGEKGSAVWRTNGDLYAELVESREENGSPSSLKKVLPEYKWNGREGHDGCLDEMFDYFESGKIPMTACTDNIKTMEMVFNAIKSSETGEKVYF